MACLYTLALAAQCPGRVAADETTRALSAIRDDSAGPSQGVFIWQGLAHSGPRGAAALAPHPPSATETALPFLPTSPTPPEAIIPRRDSVPCAGAGPSTSTTPFRPLATQPPLVFSNGLSPPPPSTRGCMAAMLSHVSLELRTSSSSWLGSCLDLPTALDAAVAALPAAALVAALAAEDSHFVSGGGGGGGEVVGAVGALTGRVAAALAGCGELRLREVRRMPVWRQQVGWCGAGRAARGAWSKRV